MGWLNFGSGTSKTFWPMKKFRRLVVLLLLTALMVVALVRLSGGEINRDSLSEINWGWFSAALGIFIVTILVRGTRWHRILMALGWPTRLLYTSTLLVAGMFISSILPARLGDVGRIVMLKQDHRVPIAQGLASIAAERALDIFAILSLTLVTALLAFQGQIPPEYVRLIIGTTILFVAGLITLVAMPSLEQWLRFSGWQPTTGLPQKLWGWYQKGLDFGFSLVNGVRSLGKSPVALIIALLESYAIWFGEGIILYFSLLSVQALIPFSTTVFSMMISDLVAAVPLTPAALGQFDGALLGLLTFFGLTTAKAGLALLLLRVISLWFLIPVSGLVTYLFGFSRALNLSPQALGLAESAAQVSLDSQPAPIKG